MNDPELNEMEASLKAFKTGIPSLNRTFWDIETASLTEAELLPLMPEFSAPSNYKDPVKIRESIDEQKKLFVEKAALSPITGKVLCIGIMDNEGFKILSGDECDVLSSFWSLWKESKRQFVGWNTHGFDLPFLIRRSWKHGIQAKPFLKPWNLTNSLDLMEYWNMGDITARISLDRALAFLGLPQKTGNGKDFANLWFNDRPAAEAYLQRDVESVRDLYERMNP